MKILVWGCGNMAQAFVKGLKQRNPSFAFHLYNPSPEKAQALASAAQGHVVKGGADERYDVVILGFKPQKLSEAAAQLSVHLSSRSTILSLLAATELARLASFFPNSPLIRVMANLPVERNSGIVLWRGQGVDEINWQNIFAGLGIARLVSEPEMDLYTLHAGCSPAFIYQWVKDAGHFASTHGGDEALARELFIYALSAALEGIKHDHSQLAERISSVASKGGVTEAALKKFQEVAPRYIEEGFLAGLKRIGELKG